MELGFKRDIFADREVCSPQTLTGNREQSLERAGERQTAWAMKR